MEFILHKKLTETAGGPQITGRYAPTNALLKPEEDPTENGRMRSIASVNDEFTDPERLELDKINDISSEHPLGDGKQYPQEDGKDDEEARVIADRIIQGRSGKLPAPEKKGTLFPRTPEGKLNIRGLENPDVRAEKARKAEKVRDILKSI